MTLSLLQPTAEQTVLLSVVQALVAIAVAVSLLRIWKLVSSKILWGAAVGRVSNKRHIKGGKTPFLDKLRQADYTTPFDVSLHKNFLSPKECQELFEALNNDVTFPWKKNQMFMGKPLPQDSYFEGLHNLERATNQKYPALLKLQQICRQVQREFGGDGQVTNVFCNRFDGSKRHHTAWHVDTYGAHIMVLSLGATGRVQFRPLDNHQSITTLEPQPGDLYFMPLAVNHTHEHRVCPPATDGTRISLVFFFYAPSYAHPKYQITWWDTIHGWWTALKE